MLHISCATLSIIVAESEAVLQYEEIFVPVLLPGLKNGLRSKNEMVCLEVLGYLAEYCKQIASLQECALRLKMEIEVAHFFNNLSSCPGSRRSSPSECSTTNLFGVSFFKKS